MIAKINKIFEENHEPALMTKNAVIVNCGRIFTDTVTSIENTLRAEGVTIKETSWNAGLGAYVIKVEL